MCLIDISNYDIMAGLVESNQCWKDGTGYAKPDLAWQSATVVYSLKYALSIFDVLLLLFIEKNYSY